MRGTVGEKRGDFLCKDKSRMKNTNFFLFISAQEFTPIVAVPRIPSRSAPDSITIPYS